MALATARVPGGTGHVPLHAHGRDEAGALLVAPADLGAEHAGGDHAGVARRLQAVEGERVAAGHDHQRVGARRDRQRRNDVVGDEQADDVGVACRFNVGRREAVGLGGLACVVVANTDADVDARVPQVEGPRAALVAVADDRQPLPFQGREVAVGFVQDLSHGPGP